MNWLGLESNALLTLERDLESDVPSMDPRSRVGSGEEADSKKTGVKKCAKY